MADDVTRPTFHENRTVGKSVLRSGHSPIGHAAEGILQLMEKSPLHLTATAEVAKQREEVFDAIVSLEISVPGIEVASKVQYRRGESLDGRELDGERIESAILRRRSICGSSAVAVEIIDSTIDRCRVRHSVFNRSCVVASGASRVLSSWTQWKDSTFRRVSISETCFVGCDFSSVVFEDCDFLNVSFVACDFSDAQFIASSFEDCSILCSTAEGAGFQFTGSPSVRFIRTDLRLARRIEPQFLPRVTVEGCELPEISEAQFYSRRGRWWTWFLGVVFERNCRFVAEFVGLDYLLMSAFVRSRK